MDINNKIIYKYRYNLLPEIVINILSAKFFLLIIIMIKRSGPVYHVDVVQMSSLAVRKRPNVARSAPRGG